MKLRVLACAFACSPGGSSERYGGGELVLGWNLVRQLGRFYEVWALTSSDNRARIEACWVEQQLPNVHFCYVSLPAWLGRLQKFQGGIQFYAYLWQMKSYLVARHLHRRLRFDVFHHITYANDWMASFLGALLQVPYIRGPGGGAQTTPRAFLPEYSLRHRLWERFRSFAQWLFRHDLFFLLGQHRARALLVCNHESLEAIPPRWRRKAQLFPVNGISAQELAWTASADGSGSSNNDRDSHGESKRFRVLSAGKLLGIKGFGLAIGSFKIFVEKHPEAEFTLVGDGPELPRIEALLHQMELERQVCLKNWMPREALLAEMVSCDVFVFPSLRDGGGAVVVEAMAASKPIICLDLAGPAVHVTNACGIKIAPHSPRQTVLEMAAALERLYTDQELRRQMGRAARARAEQVYAWDRLGDRLREIYAQCLNNQ